MDTGAKILMDRWERRHDYLRISLTDHCNFRCTYCMPDEKVNCMPATQLMQVHEIQRIAQTFVEWGVRKIRLTGGEPLVRKDFPQIVRALASLPVELAITTNGLLVKQYWDVFQEADLRTINVSLDSLRPETFFQITGRDHFRQVWDTILFLLDQDIRVKINVVAMRSTIQAELIDFITLTKDLPLHVRFIEFMPFTGNGWDSHQVITATEMLNHTQAYFDIIKLQDEPHATAKKYKVIGYEGTFAFITTMSNHFCHSCNRLRLTADGKLKNCLFGKDEMDLLGALRTNQDILPLIQQSLMLKHPATGGQLLQDFQQINSQQVKNRSMVCIGG